MKILFRLFLLGGLLAVSGCERDINPFALSQGIYPSDGTVTAQLTIVQTYDAPDNWPGDMTYDGTYVYVTGIQTDKIYKINPANGAQSGIITPSTSMNFYLSFTQSSADGACGLVYANNYLWCTATNNYSYAYKFSRGGTYQSYISRGFFHCMGMAWDGSNFWMTDLKNKYVKKISTTGQLLGNYNLSGRYPRGCTYADGYLWIIERLALGSYDHKIVKRNPANMEVILTLDSPATSGSGITYDGTYFWISDTANNIGKIHKVSLTE